MKQRWLVRVSSGALTVLTVGAGVMAAHHSVAATYLRGTVTIDGTLKEFIWRNPHSFMKVEAPDDKGEKYIWTIEGAAPQQLTEAGLTTSTFRPGDRVVVTGQPGRIPEDHRLLLHTIMRPSDGVTWQTPAAQN
jgi:hypothetical protein